MAAVVLMLLFICLAPHVFLYPTPQGCSVSFRTRPASWTLPFCACFSYAYLWPYHGRRRRGVQEEEANKEKAVGLLHRMRERVLAPIVCVNRRTSTTGRAFNLSSGERSWCGRGVPRLVQMVKVFISLSMLVPAPIMPCLAKGASEFMRLEGQAAGFSEELHRGNKGTDALVLDRGYKPGELLSPPRDWISGKFSSEEAALKDSESVRTERPKFGERDGSWEPEEDRIIVSDALGSGAGETGDETDLPANQHSLDIENSHFGRLISDCFRVKCSPPLTSSFDLKQQQQQLKDEPPEYILNSGVSPPFQHPTAPPQVAIIPPFLEWGAQPIFTPSTASLTVVNTCNSTQLKVFQPFSTDVQFYASGFEESIVSPGETVSIPIVFLPRALGLADAMIIVQTSAGGFLVHAQGRGIASPYQVESLQGLRVASGEVLRSTITLYNPHEEGLTVTDVYVPLSRAEDSSFQSRSSSSLVTAATDHHPSEEGDDLVVSSSSKGVSPCTESPNGAYQLELKPFHGGLITQQRSLIEGQQQHQLKVESQSCDPIADLKFEAVDVGRYTGFLHIKLQRGKGETKASSSDYDELIMIPVDLQVVGEGGDGVGVGVAAQEVVSVVDVLEFGVLTKEEQTSKVDVVLYNPGSEAVEVEDIKPVLDDGNIVHIEFRRGHVLPPTSETEVAVVTYMGKEETVPINSLRECDPQELLRDRMLIVRTNSSVSPKVEVPYRALVFHGSSVDCGDPAAQGSVGFVPQISSDGTSVGGGAAVLMLHGGASGQRAHFANDRSVPLQLFQDLETRARNTGTGAVSVTLRNDDDFCCYESSPGHLSVAAVSRFSILLSPELLFPLVQTGKQELHWVNIVNPSEKPLHVQALVSSRAEPTARSCQVDDGGRNPEAQGLCCTPGDNLMVAAHDDVFSFADGAILEALVEPHGNSALGPVVFRPPERCSWTGLLAIWNNLTQVEWVPLLGSGGSGSLTFLDGECPINDVQLEFNFTGIIATVAGAIEEHSKVDLNSGEGRSALCSRRVSREFLAKNTGDVHLHVAGVELHGGGCSAHGFVVESCREEFSLAPGQSTGLSVSFQPDLSTGVLRRDLQLKTSAGVVQLPVLAILPDYNDLCSVVGDSTKLYKALLWVSTVALFVVLAVFIRMLAREMLLPEKQVPTNVIRSNPLARGGRHIAPILMSSHSLILSKGSSSSSVPVAAGRGVKSGVHNEADVQSKAGGGGDGPGASPNAGVQGKPKDSTIKGGPVRASKVVGVPDACTTAVTSPGASSAPFVSESKADVPPPAPSLPGLRVKIPNSAAWCAQKSNLGSPMREASSAASGVQFRKGSSGTADKRSNVGGKVEGSHTAKIVPEPPSTEGNLLAGAQVMKQSSPLVRSAVSNSSSTSNMPVAKQAASDGERSQQWNSQTLSRPVNPNVRSPRKSNNSLQSAKHAPSSQQAQQVHQPWMANEKDKGGRRKKRRSNVGTVKHESVSKGKSGSSSPLSSPASPATPAASSSRPVSPLLHSSDVLQQPNTPGSSSSSTGGCPSGGSTDYSRRQHLVATTIPSLSKLDVEENFSSPSATEAGNEKLKVPTTNAPMLYRGESLSVDVASTALREMAQAKSIDLTWATLTAKSSRPSVEKGYESSSVGKRGSVPKDWVSVARKAVGSDSTIAGREGEVFHERNWPRKMRAHGTGNFGSPALTPSATFPRRQASERRSNWGAGGAEDEYEGNIKPMGILHPAVPVSTMPPASRAPGAKLAPKPFPEDARGGEGGDWVLKSDDSEEFRNNSNSWGDLVGSKGDDSPSRRSELSTEEDKGVYDIWGDHFGEFSRCSSQIVGSVTPGGPAEGAGAGAGLVQSLAVLDAAPSFFSSFPVPTVSSLDNPTRPSISPAVLPGSNNLSGGFSVFSQAPDVEALCLPSTLFNSPKTTPSSSHFLYPDRSNVSSSINLGLGRNVAKYHALGGSGVGGGGSSVPGSPRKPRGPYSPPLCPSSHVGSELASPVAISESSSSSSGANDPSAIWSLLHRQQGSSAI